MEYTKIACKYFGDNNHNITLFSLFVNMCGMMAFAVYNILYVIGIYGWWLILNSYDPITCTLDIDAHPIYVISSMIMLLFGGLGVTMAMQDTSDGWLLNYPIFVIYKIVLYTLNKIYNFMNSIVLYKCKK